MQTNAMTLTASSPTLHSATSLAVSALEALGIAAKKGIILRQWRSRAHRTASSVRADSRRVRSEV